MSRSLSIMLSRSRPLAAARSLAVAVAALSLSAAPARGDDCRDATGEPVPCAAAEGPPPAAPAPVYEPPPASASGAVTPSAPRAPDAGGIVSWEIAGESLDLRALTLTPATPEDVPDLARGTTVVGQSSPVDVPAMSFAVSLAPRPLRWLEIPTLRLAWGFGTPEATAPVLDQAARTVELGGLLFLRLEIGAGVDVPIDEHFSIFARGHVALAGYFVQARLDDEALGSLGRTWLAEDAWEAGWTAGLAVRFEHGLGWRISYRHVHTGVEAHVLAVGVSVELR